MLRIRKVIQYLCDKISCTPHPACIGANYASASTANEGKSVVEAKKVYIELYCQGKVRVVLVLLLFASYPFFLTCRSFSIFAKHWPPSNIVFVKLEELTSSFIIWSEK